MRLRAVLRHGKIETDTDRSVVRRLERSRHRAWHPDLAGSRPDGIPVPADRMFRRSDSTSRSDEPGKASSGWFLTTPGYEVIVTPEKARQGKHCVRIRTAKAKDPEVAVLLRTIDATPYRGSSIRLRGALRIEAAKPEDRVQLWLRVDREGDKTGFFDNMNDRPVRQRDWSGCRDPGRGRAGRHEDRLRAAALRRRAGLGR